MSSTTPLKRTPSRPKALEPISQPPTGGPQEKPHEESSHTLVTPVKPGDHIYVWNVSDKNMNVFAHHAIVETEAIVILLDNGQITRWPLDDFLIGYNLPKKADTLLGFFIAYGAEKLVYPAMLTRVRDQPAVVVERAKSLLMTKDPATLPDFSSCEEFACFCKTGSQSIKAIMRGSLTEMMMSGSIKLISWNCCACQAGIPHTKNRANDRPPTATEPKPISHSATISRNLSVTT